jgi:release factor glutamine methyltransferase
VVSNPPYVEPDEIAALPADARADPEVALAGDVGLYRRLFTDAVEWLRPGGSVVVEIGERRGAAVSAAAAAAGLLEIRVLPDLVGRDRVVVARRP